MPTAPFRVGEQLSNQYVGSVTATDLDNGLNGLVYYEVRPDNGFALFVSGFVLS